MATVLTRKPEQRTTDIAHNTLETFLTELGELSRRHGIAIGDGASLYVMEQEDYARSYLASDESELSFA